jgi:hypothetical protein
MYAKNPQKKGHFSLNATVSNSPFDRLLQALRFFVSG